MNSLPQSGDARSSQIAAAEKCLAGFDFRGAIEILERLNKQAPTDRMFIQIGAAYACAFDFAAAERAFQEGLRLSTGKVNALNTVGHLWSEVRHYEAARNCFEAALALGKAPAATFLKLGEIYVRTRRLEDAWALGERAKTEVSDFPVVGQMICAKVHRQRGELEMAEKELRAVLTQITQDSEGRAAAFYELAAVLDQQRRFDEAMAAFVEAKGLMNRSAARAQNQWRTKQMWMKQRRTALTKSVVQRWRKFGQSDLQPTRKLAVLCGEARSGTTLLEYALDAHPQIISADETSVFHHTANALLARAVSPSQPLVAGLDWISARVLRQIRTDYFRGMESFFGQAVGERLLVDKNPTLTFDLPALTRIFPELKLLIAVRDPRDVCLSCFMQPAPLLVDTVSWLTVEGTIDHYVTLMESWLSWKPALTDQAIEVRYEDLVEDLESATRRVLDFLGVPWDERVLNFHQNASAKVVRSPTFAEVTRAIFKSSIGRWRNYEKYFAPHLERLTPFLRAFGCE